MNLTRQDLETLIEAVGDWEQVHCRAQGPIEAFLSGNAMLQVPHCDDPECENCKSLKAGVDTAIKRKVDSMKMISERSVLLRAKLIAMRDAADVEKLFEQAKESEAGNGTY